MKKKKTGQKYSNCKVIFIVRYLLVTSDTIRKSKRQISIIFSLFTQDGYEDELMGQCLRGVGIKPTITTDDEVIVITCIVLFVFCTVIFDTQQRKFNNNKTLYGLQCKATISFFEQWVSAYDIISYTEKIQWFYRP